MAKSTFCKKDQIIIFFTVRLSEKKAQIGYTYEDSTVTEPDEQMEKENEDDSENSESEEDEVIPDIGAFLQTVNTSF